MEDDVQLRSLAKRLVNIYNTCKLSTTRFYLRKKKHLRIRPRETSVLDITTDAERNVSQCPTQIRKNTKVQTSKNDKPSTSIKQPTSLNQNENFSRRKNFNEYFEKDFAVNVCSTEYPNDFNQDYHIAQYGRNNRMGYEHRRMKMMNKNDSDVQPYQKEIYVATNDEHTIPDEKGGCCCTNNAMRKKPNIIRPKSPPIELENHWEPSQDSEPSLNNISPPQTPSETQSIIDHSASQEQEENSSNYDNYPKKVKCPFYTGGEKVAELPPKCCCDGVESPQPCNCDRKNVKKPNAESGRAHCRCNNGCPPPKPCCCHEPPKCRPCEDVRNYCRCGHPCYSPPPLCCPKPPTKNCCSNDPNKYVISGESEEHNSVTVLCTRKLKDNNMRDIDDFSPSSNPSNGSGEMKKEAIPAMRHQRINMGVNVNNTYRDSGANTYKRATTTTTTIPVKKTAGARSCCPCKNNLTNNIQLKTPTKSMKRHQSIIRLPPSEDRRHHPLVIPQKISRVPQRDKAPSFQQYYHPRNKADVRQYHEYAKNHPAAQQQIAYQHYPKQHDVYQKRAHDVGGVHQPSVYQHYANEADGHHQNFGASSPQHSTHRPHNSEVDRRNLIAGDGSTNSAYAKHHSVHGHKDDHQEYPEAHQRHSQPYADHQEHPQPHEAHQRHSQPHADHQEYPQPHEAHQRHSQPHADHQEYPQPHADHQQSHGHRPSPHSFQQLPSSVHQHPSPVHQPHPRTFSTSQQEHYDNSRHHASPHHLNSQQQPPAAPGHQYHPSGASHYQPRVGSHQEDSTLIRKHSPVDHRFSIVNHDVVAAHDKRKTPCPNGSAVCSDQKVRTPCSLLPPFERHMQKCSQEKSDDLRSVFNPHQPRSSGLRYAMSVTKDALPCCSQMPKGGGDHMVGVNDETKEEIKALLCRLDRTLTEEAEMHCRNMKGIVHHLGKQECEIKELKVAVIGVVEARKAPTCKKVHKKIRKMEEKKEKEESRQREQRAREMKDGKSSKGLREDEHSPCCSCKEKKSKGGIGCCGQCCARRCGGCCGKCCGGCCVSLCNWCCKPCEACCEDCCCGFANCCDYCCSCRCCRRKKKCRCQ